jgi:hypothetical protein
MRNTCCLQIPKPNVSKVLFGVVDEVHGVHPEFGPGTLIVVIPIEYGGSEW